jgi:LacI family transcriptional regulator, galactose operon repressor
MASLQAPAGSGKVTRTDVARYVGVYGSCQLCHQRGPKPVATATAARVRETIKALQYQPNATARALSLGSLGCWG